MPVESGSISNDKIDKEIGKNTLRLLTVVNIIKSNLKNLKDTFS